MKERFSLILLSACSLSGLFLPALADCTGLPALKTKPLVDSFLIRPAGLLDRNPYGGVEMSGTISTLVGADPDRALKPVLLLLGKANQYQEQSIGTGLGSAARLCVQAQQPWKARQLEQEPQLSDDRIAMAAFMTAYRGDAPDLPVQADTGDRSTNPLGLGQVAAPEVNVFKPAGGISNPFKPVR